LKLALTTGEWHNKPPGGRRTVNLSIYC